MPLKVGHKVTAIIPAYNEEQRIASVLASVEQASIIDQIVVVNDGSTDRTAEVVKDFRDVILINKKVNAGKGAALAAGVAAGDGDILIFIDADLVGLTPEHIDSLIGPLLEDDELMMNVGKFAGGRLRTDLPQSLVPFISGQRALRRSLLEGLDLSKTKFGAEIALTRYAKERGVKVEEVIITDVTHVMKEEKLGVMKGGWARLSMYSDMLKNLFSSQGDGP